MHVDMSAMLHNVTAAVQDLSVRISHTENKISDICHAHNDVIDTITDHDQELKCISAKLAGLEDHSRHNNIKFRGIPETVTQPLLHDYLTQLL